jgi:hypothetical protein
MPNKEQSLHNFQQFFQTISLMRRQEFPNPLKLTHITLKKTPNTISMIDQCFLKYH